MKNKNWLQVIGEIFIVVLGILIAFGLNNWAEARSDRKKEIRYLENLELELRKDSAAIATELATVQQKEQLAKKVIPHFYQNIPGRDTIALTIFRDLGTISQFVPHESIFQALLYSGDLDLINNFELRSQIIDYYNQLDKKDLGNEQALQMTTEWVVPYFMERSSFANMSRNSLTSEKMGLGTDDMLGDYRLQNIVYAYFGIYGIKRTAFAKAAADCNSLLQNVETELAQLR